MVPITTLIKFLACYRDQLGDKKAPTAFLLLMRTRAQRKLEPEDVQGIFWQANIKPEDVPGWEAWYDDRPTSQCQDNLPVIDIQDMMAILFGQFPPTQVSDYICSPRSDLDFNQILREELAKRGITWSLHLELPPCPPSSSL